MSQADGTGGPFANSISKDDLVAVTVTVDADHGVANQMHRETTSNIATTSTDARGIATTSYMMENVKVLAVGSTTLTQQAAAAPAGGSAPPQTSGVLTFEVTSADALRVIAANSGNSKLYLVLLPPATGAPTASSGTKAAASGK